MLDPIGRAEVMKTIRELNRSSGVTVVLITHHMDEAAQADRLVVMAKGRVVADGTPRKVFQRVEELKAVGLTVPETTELLWQLRQAGVDVPLDALSDEECAQALFDRSRPCPFLSGLLRHGGRGRPPRRNHLPADGVNFREEEFLPLSGLQHFAFCRRQWALISGRSARCR